ncbi:hypothetical protein [Herbaspirillum robiniae]|uniref:Uncharacterized protein n=1 Tax=Herbaspirillum robiniae TaxID=2014887 RepID=A0ABX2M8N7_9BURK|nr:hypothetical protein [Herbaspirillum robiniae]NUU04576.1 hypothetical protein [Herbaspirillum robiniae]
MKKNSPINSGYFFASRNFPVSATAQNHQKTGCSAKKVHCGAKEKGSPVGEPFKYWCWLQDLNPPNTQYLRGFQTMC